MKTFSTYAIAALLAASTSSMALAQAAGATTDVDAGASAGAGTDAGAGAGADAAAGGAAGASAGAGANAGTGAASDAGTTASGGSAGTGAYDADHQRLITSITAASSIGQDYQSQMEAVNSETTVEIVEVSELRGTTGTDTAMLDQALGDLEDSREEIRSAVEGNEQVMQALEDEEFAAEDVVAIDFSTGIDNKVTLVVDAAGS